MIEELKPYCVAEYEQGTQLARLANNRLVQYWAPKLQSASRVLTGLTARKRALQVERDAFAGMKANLDNRGQRPGLNKDDIHKDLYGHFIDKANREIATLNPQIKEAGEHQADALQGRQEKYDFERGICFGLCCKWIETHTHDPKWQNDVRNARAEQRIRNLHVHGLKGEDDAVGADQVYSSVLGFFQALNTQRSYYIAEVEESRDATGLFHQKSHPEIFNLGLRKHGFAIGETEIAQKTDPKTRDLLFTTNGSSKTLVGELTQRPGYRLIILRYPDPLSYSKRDMFHATCCYHTDGYMFGIGSHHCFFDPNLGEFWIPWGDVSKFYRLVYEDYASRYRNISGYVTFPVARVSAPQS